MARQFDPYNSSQGTEPNLRLEFEHTMDGFFPELSKRQKFVFRKMRTEDGVLVRCSCVDILTKEADKDVFCPVCFGAGYLWDESLIDGYRMIVGRDMGLAGNVNVFGPGNVVLNYIKFFFRYDLPINILSKHVSPDKIIELITDQNGDPVRPYTRERIYRIGTAIDFRSDRGKIDYWKLDCYEEQTKFLNGPNG